MGDLPKRTADTMSEAIALASPSGRMSKRARESAQKHLGEALFGSGGLQRPGLPKQPTERERLVIEAVRCRDHASGGMRPRANIRQAEWCERRIAEIDAAEKFS